MTRAKIVIGNWKMNPPTIDEAVALARAVSSSAPYGDVTVGVAPPSIALVAVSQALRGSQVAVYAQDVSPQEKGAYTGQVAVSMIRGIAAGAIVGHSETRRDLGDDDARVAKKLSRVLSAGLRVVLCIGESEAEFEDGATHQVLAAQLALPLQRLYDIGDRDIDVVKRFVVAYEPIWAIGTGRPATGSHAAAAAATIRREINSNGIDEDVVPILYGGSVTAAGVAEFAAAEGIDGALVGGASLKAEEFASIVRAFA